MCMCNKPTINGEPGYSWNGKSTGVYQPQPPSPGEHESVKWDLPGRCGGLDSHSYHFRTVAPGGDLLVRHGGGEERIRIGSRPAIKVLEQLDDNARYWIFQMLYHVQNNAATQAREDETARWRKAAAGKHIRTRKERGGNRIKVWIEAGKPSA